MAVWIILLYYSYYKESCVVSLTEALIGSSLYGFGCPCVRQSLVSFSGCPCLSSFSLFSSSFNVFISNTRLVNTMLIASEKRNLDRSLRAMPSVSCASSMLLTMIIIPNVGVIALSMIVVSLFFVMVSFVYLVVIRVFWTHLSTICGMLYMKKGLSSRTILFY